MCVVCSLCWTSSGDFLCQSLAILRGVSVACVLTVIADIVRDCLCQSLEILKECVCVCVCVRVCVCVCVCVC